ncbi:unnamed protein product [Cunninghamella blakesleeana]
MSLPQGNFLQAVRTTCRQAVEKSPVKISEKGIKDFLDKLEKPVFEEYAIDTPIRMPVKFNTTADEINFICFIDLLNFGSGYRLPLHELAGRGAFDTIRYGAMSFHIGGTPFSAEKFETITIQEVASIFQFPIEKEVHPPNMDFVTLIEGNELKPFAQGITDVLHSTGKFLKEQGYKDLASFILDITKPLPGKQPSASHLVEQLIRALPGLQDAYTLHEGERVYLFKKAQILTYHLWLIFRDQEPERFDFYDVHQMTIFSDNVIPTMLIHFGVIEIPDDWQQLLDQGKDVGEYKATIMRAAGVIACEDIVKLTRLENGNDQVIGPIHHMEEGALDVYLWRIGKVGDYRKVPRMQLRDTVMF